MLDEKREKNVNNFFHLLRLVTESILFFNMERFSDTKYRVTHQGWDCNNDFKLLIYDDPKVELNPLS